ncbi:delta-type opioid receptor-like [Branchiostoma floridae]|uniref:Delta-type opioid receptor-like n=1 Tax=Branchiostoma floridae TaxID=7739 RepID=A0A9J7MVU7_BRAFL|nr:delta-type opioid receptor-like [Branchiostoma floridae]
MTESIPNTSVQMNFTFTTPADMGFRSALSDMDTAEIALSSIVYFAGLLGNAVVIYIIIRNERMRTVPNVYIFNMALADGIYCLMGPLWMSFRVIDWIWLPGSIVCRTMHYLQFMTMFGSSCFLTILSVQRYRSVVHPFQYMHRRTVPRAVMYSGLVWLAVLVLSVPCGVLSHLVVQDSVQVCVYASPSGTDVQTFGVILQSYVLVLAFLVPLCVVTPHYMLLQNHMRGAGQTTSVFKARNRVTRMVLVVSAVFLVTRLPLHLSRLTLTASRGVASLPDSLGFILRLLYDLDPVLNPLVYVFQGVKYRAAVVQACRCRAKINRISPSGRKYRRSQPRYPHRDTSRLQAVSMRSRTESIWLAERSLSVRSNWVG